jgi:hypothetical protein
MGTLMRHARLRIALGVSREGTLMMLIREGAQNKLLF